MNRKYGVGSNGIDEVGGSSGSRPWRTDGKGEDVHRFESLFERVPRM